MMCNKTVWMSLVAGATMFGCSSEYTRSGGTGDFWGTVASDAAAEVEKFKQADPSLSRFFESAAGYAVFPEVTKGGLVVGGAHGEGALFENGNVVGYCELKQGSIGAQIGGQSYAELIFFQDERALNQFKRGELEFSAQASAVAATKGAAANADYLEGVAVFSRPHSGLMLEASLGGQKFKYWDQ